MSARVVYVISNKMAASAATPTRGLQSHDNLLGLSQSSGDISCRCNGRAGKLGRIVGHLIVLSILFNGLASPLGTEFASAQTLAGPIPIVSQNSVSHQTQAGEGETSTEEQSETGTSAQTDRLLGPFDSDWTDESRVRRVLVDRLTNLIMNREPETIAHKMEGTHVTGQMTSESLALGRATSEGEGSDPTLGDEVSRSGPLVGKPVVASFVMDEINENPPVAIQETQTQHTASSANLMEEQSVTCSPDYEEQPFVESGGNLTSEQQMQLLAGADSAGLLDPGGNFTGDYTSSRSQSQCVQPGSRMIEVITKVITPILFSIIIVVGLLGNIIVMIVILEDRKTERELTPTNLLILDLSLADLSFIIFCIPFTAWDYSVGHWVFGSLWCKFNQYLIVVCALSSIYTLVLMSIDRFLAIVYPIECMSYRTSKNMLYAICIKWILILIMASPTIAMHGLVDSPLGPDQYNCRFLADHYNPLHFQITFFITSYLFPLILIFCLYLSLLNKLWFGSKPHGHKESLKMLESKKRVTWLVAGIVVVFALCWCPIQVMLILMRLKSHKITATYVAVQVFSHTLGYMNSCVNPIVYAFASETFHNSFKRSALGRFICMCLCLNHNRDHDGSTQHFRTNTTTLNHTIIHHHHHQQPLINVPRNSGDTNNLATGNHGNASATTLLMTPILGNSVATKKTVTLPLEPRDRVVITPPSADIRTQVAKSETVPVKSMASETTSTTSAPTVSAPAKQQLVARVGQSSNQISHRCEPCYQ